MPAPIELKFEGGNNGIIDFPVVGLMKKCMIHFKFQDPQILEVILHIMTLIGCRLHMYDHIISI